MKQKQYSGSIFKSAVAVIVAIGLSAPPAKADPISLAAALVFLVAGGTCGWLLDSARKKKKASHPAIWNGAPERQGIYEGKLAEIRKLIETVASKTLQQQPIRAVAIENKRAFEDWVPEPDELRRRRFWADFDHYGKGHAEQADNLRRNDIRSGPTGFLKTLEGNPSINAAWMLAFEKWLLRIEPQWLNDDGRAHRNKANLAIVMDQRQLEFFRSREVNGLQDRDFFLVGVNTAIPTFWDHAQHQTFSSAAHIGGSFYSLDKIFRELLDTAGLPNVSVTSVPFSSTISGRFGYGFEKGATFQVTGAKNNQEYIQANLLVLKAVAEALPAEEWIDIEIEAQKNAERDRRAEENIKNGPGRHSGFY